MTLRVDVCPGGVDLGPDVVLLTLQVREAGGVVGDLLLAVVESLLGRHQVLVGLGLGTARSRKLLLQLLTLGQEGADLVR
jgi:hypothetical protein